MREDSIDFQPIPGDDTQDKQVRHVFRVPVSFKDDIQVILDRSEYTVTNLSETGVAVNVSSCLELDSGRIIDDARLRIADVNLTGLCVKVIHCSVHDSGSFQFGLQWVHMTPENKKTLEKVLGQLKAEALKVKDLSD